MKKNGSLLISVLILAYKREAFLEEAIESVLNQTLPAENFEIIVVKNFKHQYTDELCSNGKITCVHSDEPSMGKFILSGIEKSKGDVLAFLEDDDIWDVTKLERVSQQFSEDGKLAYFHNSVKPISEDGGISFKVREYESPNWTGDSEYQINEPDLEKDKVFRLGKYFPDFNLSSIAVRKTILDKNLDWFKNLVTALDTFIFLVALNENGRVLLSKEQLTKYRRHSLNQSGTNSSDRNSFLASLYSFTEKALSAYETMEEWASEVGKSPIKRIAERRVSFTKVLNAVQSPHINRLEPAKWAIRLAKDIMIFYPKLNFQAIMLSVAYFVSPKYARKRLARSMAGE